LLYLKTTTFFFKTRMAYERETFLSLSRVFSRAPPPAAAARARGPAGRPRARPRLHLRLLCPPTRLGSRRPLGFRPCGALPRRLGQLLPQLYSLPLERRAFSLQCAEPLGSALQVLLKLAHRRALGEQPVADLLLQRRAAGQLLSDGCEVALGRDALGGGRTPLLLRLDDAGLL